MKLFNGLFVILLAGAIQLHSLQQFVNTFGEAGNMQAVGFGACFAFVYLRAQSLQSNLEAIEVFLFIQGQIINNAIGAAYTHCLIAFA